ncbi:F-box/kelch-repeat protein At3g23880-like [Apium graveolens]|uniref:F-box/kelch-repeat protein At3g23880-like n=1 Tax=Apium graveolens TaxID=4045 RepID=UPI003D7B1C2C
MANYHDFHEQIVFQILAWVPVIYLFRCKSVCKQWLSIISNPLFDQTRLINSHQRPSILAVAETSGDSRYGFCGISNSFKDSAILHLPTYLSGNQDYWSLSSCNGLVCFSDYKAIDIYLWNPSTRQCCNILSPPKIPSKKWAFTGLYFDSICNDYKILRINVYHKYPVRVEIYSTNSGSWREIEVDDEVETSITSMINCGLVIKETLYINGRDELISFQLHNEMFKLVPLPSVKLRVVMDRRSSIFDYEGRVGLILHCHDDETLSLWLVTRP